MIDEQAVAALTGWTVHGGRLSDAQKAFPGAPLPWLDLSTGINPEPWPGTSALAFDWERLPDEAALHALEAAAAACFGARSQQVLALPGTEFGLRGLASLGLPAPFRHVWPGYRTHAEALPGSEAIAFETAAKQAARGGTIMLANPSNPDGRLVPPADLLALAHRLGEAGGWLVVDEAFVDAHSGHSIVPLLDGTEPVIVTRSFGKFFGLAGVRLGFVLANKPVIRKLRDVLGDWPISGAAIAIGTAAYCDRAWQGLQRHRLAQGSARLTALLSSHGLDDLGGTANFRLCHVADAPGLFTHLCRAGILVRPFADRPDRLRFGIPGTDADWARLDTALQTWRSAK